LALLWFVMPRVKRKFVGGIAYHVLNRANGRLRIFRKPDDFEAFERVLAEGLRRIPMRLCGYCIMSNHWHLLLWPRPDDDVSEFMHWITLTHTQRWQMSQKRYRVPLVHPDIIYKVVSDKLVPFWRIRKGNQILYNRIECE